LPRSSSSDSASIHSCSGSDCPTDGAHAPNEHFDVESLDRGIRTMVEFFRRVGA
jgi:acetylornithine deacetylase/succinyl-diaminopimelate desuccinylase-like protein